MKKWVLALEEIKFIFSFLKDSDYEVIEEEEGKLFSYLVYQSKNRKIVINFDYLGYEYFIDIYKSPSTTYSDDGYDTKDLLSLFRLIKMNDKDFDIKRLIPIYKNGLNGELELCAELLQKYGEKILKGEEWY